MAALALVMVLGTVALAADAPATPSGPGQCENFVDADGDGVCDNLGQNVPARDGSGRQSRASQQRAGAGSGQGHNAQGSEYIDADGDGVCDNLGQNVPARDGSGRQRGGANGQGSGQGNGQGNGRSSRP
jgi:hypothetical protein